MKINIQKLRGMGFKEENVPPYGQCIVIPEDKFEMGWSEALTDQEYPLLHTEISGNKVVLVRLMVEEGPGREISPTVDTVATSTTVTASTVKPPKRIPAWLLKNPEHLWTDDDDKKLINLWNQKPKLSVVKFAKEFPKRTLASVYGRLSELQKAGVIKQRKPHKHPKHPGRKAKRAKEKLPGAPAPGPAAGVEAVRTVEVSYSIRQVSYQTLGTVNIVEVVMNRLFEEKGSVIEAPRARANGESDEARVASQVAQAVFMQVSDKLHGPPLTILQLTWSEYESLGKPTVNDVVTVALEKKGGYGHA